MTTLEYDRPTRDHLVPLKGEDIQISAPPTLPSSSGGFLQFIVPAVGALGSAAFFLMNPNPITLAVSGVVLVTAIGGGFLVRWQQGRTTKQRAEQARAQYRQSLMRLDERLKHDAEQQRMTADALYPAPQELLARVGEATRNRRRAPERLWERRWTDDDFLDARVGWGNEPLSHKLTPQPNNANPLDIDTNLVETVSNLVSNYVYLPDMPKVIGLRRAGALAVCGEGAARREFTRAALLNLAYHHAPSDLRLLLYAPPDVMGQWSWLKWLPHTRALQRMENIAATEPTRFCMMADTVADFELLLQQQIMPEFERRSQARTEQHGAGAEIPAENARPHIIIVADGYTRRGDLARVSELNRMLERVTADANQSEAAGVAITILALTDSRDTEPATLSGRFEIQAGNILGSGTGLARYAEVRQGGRVIEAIGLDQAPLTTCETVARALTPITLGFNAKEVDLSREVRLFPLLGFNSIDEINDQQLWQPRTPHNMLVTPVGMGENGAPLTLNLREPAEGGIGPHGMLVGQPGMGKTEFLRTLTLGLAMTHSWEEVNFIFVDYKGEAGFGDLATLPHSVGLVTRVEQDSRGDLIQRLHQELEGERARRAAILGKGKTDKISLYHALRRTQPSLEPLPYLFLVVDEYAALLAKHQDLRKLFVELGQQGRSLGMNMILATQSPSGGNLQELESYLSYRISVRTLTAADSSAALGSPDAYFLPSFIPGLAYLKTDRLTKFRVARTTAQYQPPTTISEAEAAANTPIIIQQFDRLGALIPLRSGPAQKTERSAADTEAPTEKPKTELIVSAERLRAAAKERHTPRPHQVWVPPLPRVMTLGQVAAEAGIELLGPTGWPASGAGAGALERVPLGRMDDIFNQRQPPYLYDFTGQGGHLAVVGVPQSGASTLLKTIITALIATTSPRDVQFYLLDAGGGRLKSFAQAPHVGAVCSGNETDVARRMIAQIRGIIRRRAERFQRENLSGAGALREQRASLPPDGDDQGADVFLVIDNLNALRAIATEGGFDMDLNADLAAIAGTGLSYGVHLLVSSQTDLHPSIANNVRGRIELLLAEPRASMLGKTPDGVFAATLTPPEKPGAGVVAGPYLFQAALPLRAIAPEDIEQLDQCSPGQLAQRCDEEVATLCAAARDCWSGPATPGVRLLPTMVREREIAQMANLPETGFTLGIEEAGLQPFALDLTQSGPHFLIYGDRQHGKTALIRLLLRDLAQRYSPDEAKFVLIDPKRELLEWTKSPHMLRNGEQFGYALNKEMLDSCLALLTQQLIPRKTASGRLTLDELQRLREGGRSWVGPRLFVFYDDFESNGVMGNSPLMPLNEYVNQTEDIGFHLIVTRQLADAIRSDNVVDKIKNGGSPILVMGAADASLVPGGLARGKILLPGRGFLVRQGPQVTQLQITYAEESE